MGETHISGAELEKALNDHTFDHPPAQLTGMVKEAEKPGYINFTSAGCDAWVEIPSAMIAEAEHIGQQPCKDHSHPVFRLSLKPPTDPQSKVLMALLAARSPAQAPPAIGLPPSAPAPQGMSAMLRGGGGFGGAGLTGQCSSFCSGSTLWCMCPVYIPGIGMGYSVYPCGTCINDPVFTAYA